jgi:hypothetical protein
MAAASSGVVGALCFKMPAIPHMFKYRFLFLDTPPQIMIFYISEIPTFQLLALEGPMSQTKPLTKLVRPLPKGQITLPIEFRRRLNEILPLRPMSRKADLREYEEDEIQAFLKEDRLDPKTAGKVRRLLRKTA